MITRLTILTLLLTGCGDSDINCTLIVNKNNEKCVTYKGDLE